MGTWGAKGSPGWSVSCPCASVSPAGNKHCVLQGRGLRLVLGVTSPGGVCVCVTCPWVWGGGSLLQSSGPKALVNLGVQVGVHVGLGV